MGLAGMFGDHLLTRKFTHLLNYILDLYNKVARGLYSHSVIDYVIVIDWSQGIMAVN